MKVVSFVAVVSYKVDDNDASMTMQECADACIQGLEEGKQHDGKIIRKSVIVATARAYHADAITMAQHGTEINRQRAIIAD